MLSWKLSKGIASFDLSCIICGTTENVHMHHVRSLQDIKKSQNIVHVHMIQLEVPLCRVHHLVA